MLICRGCKTHFSSDSWTCPICALAPIFIDNYPAFAPELAEQGDSFPIESFAFLAELEEAHFWFRARNLLISWALQRFFPETKRFLEIGCGTGCVLSAIQQTFPHIQCYGSEIYSQGLHYAAQKLNRAKLFQMDARNMPFIHEFDAIGAFDVLEHIEEDEQVLAQMHQALGSKGGIIITVPQHPFLWSHTDEYAHHVRRYTADELKTKLQRQGFTLIKMTSFVFWLMPLMWVSRFKRQQTTKKSPIPELKLNNTLNNLLEKIMLIERWMIKRGINLPFGGSLLAVAIKKP